MDDNARNVKVFVLACANVKKTLPENSTYDKGICLHEYAVVHI